MNVHVLNDPVHGVMKFDQKEKELIKGIIDTAAFQRLRNIKQLGMASYVFPGAVHTRFNHSIGASYLAKVVCDQLGVDEATRLKGIATALLHDIGHGPFSHAFEDIFSRYLGFKVDHEVTFTTEIASMSVNELLDRLQGFRGEFGGKSERRRMFITCEDGKTGAKQRDECPVCRSKNYQGRGDMTPFLDISL